MNTLPPSGEITQAIDLRQKSSNAAQTASPYYGEPVPIPDYLERHYWWAYVRPWAVQIFEREWLVNLILWGWYRRLRNAALEELGEKISGRVLHVSCCYGSLIPEIARRVELGGGKLDVIDVTPAQLDNLARKLPPKTSVRLLLRDSTNLGLPDSSYDRVNLFFLPHEQPRYVRQRTFAEAFRVLKPGGRLLIVEFGKPKWWHPLRYFYLPFLAFLEPFAPDIWKADDIFAWLPKEWRDCQIEVKTFFGGYYQRIVITKNLKLFAKG